LAKEIMFASLFCGRWKNTWTDAKLGQTRTQKWTP
jgi:hypothetical protein